MKRILALFLSAALLFLLCACGADDPENTVIASDPAGESATVPPEDTPSPEPSDEPSEEPSEEPSAEPSDEPSQAPSENPTATPAATATPAPTATPKPTATPAPTPEPTPEPTPAGVNLSAVWSQIASLGEYPAFSDTNDEFLAALYGIDSADLVSYVWKFPLMNTKATEFFIAQVKDGRMDAVRSAVQNRQATLDQTWSLYLPDQYALVKDYKLVVNGNYILFAVSEYADGAVSVFNSFTK